MASLKERIVAAEQKRVADSAAFFARADAERRAKQRELLPGLIAALEASEGAWVTYEYFPLLEDCKELSDWLRDEGLWLSHRWEYGFGSQYRLVSLPPVKRVMCIGGSDVRVFRERDW